MYYRKHVLIVLSSLMYPSLSFSASAMVENDPGLISSLVRVFSILFIILAMLFASFYLAKGPLKNLKKKMGLKDKNEIIKVLDMTTIAPKKSIGVVDVAGHIIVVGITANDIVLLARLGSEGAAGRPESGTLEYEKNSEAFSLLKGMDV